MKQHLSLIKPLGTVHRSWVCSPSVKGLLGSIVFLFVLFPLAKYVALHSNVMDMGLFERQVNAIVDGEWQTALSGHLQGYSLFLSPLLSGYSGGVVPVGISLVVFQALLLAMPAILLFRVAGVWYALTYMAYTPVWINAHFDFHYDHLAVPLMMGFYLNLRNERPWLAALFAGLLLFIKEPFALVTAACGFLMMLRGLQSKGWLLEVSVFRKPVNLESSISRNQWYLTGAALILSGLGFFYFATGYILPYFAPANWTVFATSSAFSWLGSGLGEIIRNIIAHPLGIIGEVLTVPGKLLYLFVVFGLLAFIPLLAPAYLIPAIPLLAISMLSRLPNYYDYNTHYTAGLIVPVIFAFMHGLPRAYAVWIKFLECASNKLNSLLNTQIMVDDLKSSNLFYVLIAIWIMVGHITLSPSPISRMFWSDKIWSYSWQAYVPTERDAMLKTAMLKYIPSDPSVSVSSQNSVNWHHLANRKIFVPFPMGVEKPIEVMDWSNRTWGGFWSFVYNGEKQPATTYGRYADFAVLDMKRPYFLEDKGCDWVYGKCKNKANEELFLHAVAVTRASYETVFEYDGFMILRRRR